jgi:outer membrane protein assembly factor BamB
VHARPGPGPGGAPARAAVPPAARPTAAAAPSATVAGLAEAARQDRRRSSRQREINRNRLLALGGVSLVLVLVLWSCTRLVGDDGSDTASTDDDAAQDAGGGAATGGGDGDAEQTPAGLAAPSDYDGWVDPASSGQPWSSEVLGQLTFRGNPTRSYYGLGPVPKDPEILWRYPPSGGMCGESAVGGQSKTWCGTGWTGQPSVWEQDGTTWVSFGAYDKNIHFLNAEDGSEIIGNFDMGDIIKGSVTRDPDGYPLLYSGSRADFHVLAMDRPDGQPVSLWSMDGDSFEGKWNNDWDSSPLVIDDYLFEGGENGLWFVIKLNRGEGADGLVTVDPEIVFSAPAWDDELLSDLSGSGERVNDVSVENSLAISGNTVYFSNSGGLLQGWDISGLKEGEAPTRSFRFWTGDDTDGSVVIDAEGMLYVAQEVERSSSSARNSEVGQLVKIDPSKPDDPIVWSVPDNAGIWATPAIGDGVIYAPTDGGRLLAVDQQTGELLWEKKLAGPTWQSPVVVDDVLLQGDCNGVLHAYDVSDPRVDPPELWTVELEGCIESTPTVFQGRIFVGARGGAFYAIGDA